MSAVFAGEDSEEEEALCVEDMQFLGQIGSSGTPAALESAGKVENEDLHTKEAQALDVSGITHPLDLMNKAFLHNVMPKLDVADQKLKELSVNQNELVKEMKQQKEKLHRAPALHKTHAIMRQVPQYQAKIDTLRKDMKAITALVEKMKSQSLALQLRVQEAVLKSHEQNLKHSE